MLKKFLRWYSPMAFDDGLAKCNEMGKGVMSKKRVVSMLDLGCCDGNTSMEFAKAFRAKEVHGIEFIDEKARLARKRGMKVFKRDLNQKWNLGKQRYDVILSSQNIEHMYNTRLYLEECHHYLKKGGEVIILTENLASWVNIGAMFFGWQPFSLAIMDGFSLGNPLTWHLEEKKDTEFLDKYHETGVTGTVGHIRVLTYQGLLDIMNRTGFKDVEVWSRGYLPLFGKLSDALCNIDRRHGNFLIARGVKK